MPDLSLQRKARRLRVYISESDRWRGNPLDAALLDVLRKKGMAGATVFRGAAGFGAHSHIHSSLNEILSIDMPVVVEIVDTPEKIAMITEVIYPMVREGLVTVEEVEIIKYTHRYLNPLPADKLVSEVMTTSVVALQVGMPVKEAWKKMLKERVKAAPVVDLNNKLLGILTDEDLLERAGVQQRLSVAVRMDVDDINQELRSLENSPLKIETVMTQPVITVLPGESLGTATSRMVKFGLKRLPVIDDEGKLAGVISRLDILRQVAQTVDEVPVTHAHSGVLRTVSDIMSSEIPMVNQDDDLPLVIEKFSLADSHRLIVVDSDGKVTGLISDSDVVARVQPAKRRGILDAFKNIGKLPAGKETAFDLMSPGVLTVFPETSVVDALKMMLASSRKWMVVVDEKDHPLGLVDRQMMLEAIAVFGDKD